MGLVDPEAPSDPGLLGNLTPIRLDLRRLHAGASDNAPLTTLMDAARRIREDLNRLAEARQEVEDAAGPATGRE